MAAQGKLYGIFPSYKMLEEVYAVYEEEFSVNWVKCICQNSSMKEQEREEFLQEFEQNQESLVAFALWVVIFQRELICWEKTDWSHFSGNRIAPVGK